MNFRRLRCFVAVAEELSFTRAAERLHTSQPSLSEQIRNLEDALGLTLLTRSPRKVELTAVGVVFLEEARQVLRQVEYAVARTRSAAEKARESLSIGFVPSAEVQIFPAVLPALRLQFPRVQVVLKSLTPPEQLAALNSGEIDIAFTRPPLNANKIFSEVILSDPLRVFMQNRHALARSARIAPKRLHLLPQIGTDASFSGALSELTEAYLQDHGVQAGEIQASSNILMSMNLVAGGFGYALLPAYAETFTPKNVVSRALLGAAPTIDLIMACAKEEAARSPVLLTLMALVRDSMEATSP
ncbi:LysR substrate-binding domain-containing protein [Diaphorobacter caeni]|uniref:LysR substrate-binding domain-containing protein n=1 Tax=Diaphorobacter caeni TaxID=2784387 RepID=UPI00188F01AA|nr:LysR substrate-binding domain-containing protein [Diaphorobacter caeni]MBF5007158.1 LysR family transcriptional regulator [Diaphorobacter caeni]